MNLILFLEKKKEPKKYQKEQPRNCVSLIRSAEKRAAKELRQERSKTDRGDKVPGGRFAKSDGLGLLRPAHFAA